MKNVVDIYQDEEEIKNLTPKQKLVFESAIELFSEKGYSNTSTKEIADHAGVSEGSIFRKFNNKEELLMSILRPLTHEILPEDIEVFADSVYKDPNLKTFLTTLIRNRIDLFKYNHKIMKIFLNEFIYDRQIHDRLLKEIPKSSFKRLDSVWNELKSHNLLVDWDNIEIFRFIASNILGYIIEHYFIVDAQKWNEEKEIEHVTDFIIRGLTPVN